MELFKKLYFYLLLAVFAFMLAACDILPKDTVTVTGTVIITRRGDPWNPENTYFLESRNVQNSIKIDEKRTTMQDYRPPPNYQTIFINKNLARDDIDLAQGKYTWEFEIPRCYLPGHLYLEIAVPMANFYAAKTIDIWVEDGDSEIDLGVVDFDVIRLWGSLPVTFNGEPLSNNGNYPYFKKEKIINIRSTNERDLSFSPNIDVDGNWMQDVYALDSETPLIFTLDACHRGGFFRKNLNPNHIITVHNSDKEIIFPEYPYVDFEAFALRGTIDLIVPNGHYLTNSWLNCTIGFYDTEKKEYALISYLNLWYYWKNENVSLEWETMVPPFSFPMTLLFELVYRNYYGRTVNSSIIITEETDLYDIFLGLFPAIPD